MGRWERRKERTKQAIVTAAMDLIQEHGFAETTMEQIAETADVAKGTLYNYFPAKEAIVGEWIRQTSIARHRQRLQRLPQMADTRARMLAVFTALMEGVQAQQELFEIFIIHRMQQIVSFHDDQAEPSGLELLGREIIRMGLENGELRADLPLDALQDMFEAIFVEIAKQFYKDPAAFRPETVIEPLVDLFLHGACNE